MVSNRHYDGATADGSSASRQDVQEKITYVEVPVIEEVITHVPRKEIVEIEKRVPKYEYEYVERIVEIPQVQTVHRQVEVPEEREIIKHIPVTKIIEVPKEVIKYVTKVETRIVEKDVEVAGDVIEIPKPYLVENKVIVPRYIDKEVATVVAQNINPVISESATEYIDVELKDYQPYLVPVDVYLPRPVQRNLIPCGKQDEHHEVTIPAAQYNGLIHKLNPTLDTQEIEKMYRKARDLTFPVLHGPGTTIVPPATDNLSSSENFVSDRRPDQRYPVVSKA